MVEGHHSKPPTGPVVWETEYVSHTLNLLKGLCVWLNTPMFFVFLNFSKRFTITPTAFSLKCIPDTARKPYLNLATWHGRSWEFSRLSSPVSFVSQFFPQFVSLLSPFTINRKKKTGGSFNTLVRNVTRERKHSKQGYGCHWDVTSFLSQW